MMTYKKIGFAFGLIILATLSGCLNGSSSDTAVDTPTSAVAFLHAAPVTPDLNVILDSKTINGTTSFTYAAFSGYVTMDPGPHKLRFAAVSDLTTQLDTTFTLVAKTAYSMFLYNKGSKLKTILSTDLATAFATSAGAMVRVVHLSPDLDDVKVVLVGETRNLADQIGFTEVSPFAEYTAKSTIVEVRSVTDNHVIATQSFDPLPHQYFTIAIMGYATPPSGNLNKLTVKVLTN